MILTGSKIREEVGCGRIVIDPFDSAHIEPNSYGLHLGDDIVYHAGGEHLDPLVPSVRARETIPMAGYVFEPGRLYLCSTLETMGSPHYSSTLYARRSVSTLGVWIQLEAPLGHTGAIIPWTLEIRVVHRIRIFPRMLIGKIAFWRTKGKNDAYDGRYNGSVGAVSSRFFLDRKPPKKDEFRFRSSGPEPE